MSKVNRDPVEIVEIRFPKCSNTFGVAPCTATAATGDLKCHNCRATCLDLANYRDTPDKHLTPDLSRLNEDVIASGDITRTASLFASFDVRFGLVPDGIIWEQGGSADAAAYLGVTGGNLVFRAGDGTVATGAGVGKVSIDVTAYSGMTLTLYTEIAFTASSTSTVNLWVFDPVELSLTLLGTDTFTAGTTWAGTDGGAIGTLGGSNAATGEGTANWNGDITGAFFYDSTAAPSDMTDNYRDSLYLGRGEPGEPTDEIKIYPCLKTVSAISSKINVNASDGNYAALGRRATLDFTVSDFVSSGIGRDPYYADRVTDPRTLSTFWRKELVRQKFSRVGAGVFLHNGYAEDAFADYLTRGYVLNRAEYNEDAVQFYSRDVLSKVEFNKVQIPALSTGELSADITAVQTTMSLTGDVTDQYPAAGTVRINDELATYTGRTFTTTTDFTGLTRGTDGSTAAEHETDDAVQLCKRYTSASVTDVLTDILATEAKIPAQQVDFAGIAAEDTTYLSAYVLDALITEPRGADNLLGRLSEECSFYIWWDDRTQKIRIKAARALSGSDIEKAFTDETDIIAGSFSYVEKPNERLNFVNFFYNPRDKAGDLAKPSNYANVAQVIVGEDQYGGALQLREIFSLFLSTNAQASQTAGRLALRYQDVPVFAEFMADAKDRATWVGDYITISTPNLVTASGARDVRRWLVVAAKEPIPGHVVKYTCADVTLDGSIFVITENGIGTYTAELFAAGNAFITNNDGTNIDGSQGATIS